MIRASVVSLVAGLATLAVGCGPNCQSSCERMFNDVSPDCGLAVAGVEPDELIRRCLSDCEEALETPGEVGDYNPFDPAGTGASATLDNEKQAALWMDCVAETSCTDIDDGFCAPHSF